MSGIAALLLAIASAETPADGPSAETLVYLNARMALAEGDPREAVQLWLLRNAVATRTGSVSVHDPDFRSVTWAALGDLGICPEGLPLDEDGAGLWPLAMHDWFVRGVGRRATPPRPRPFDAFEVGRQQRFVSIEDVLSASEIAEVTLYRGACLLPRALLLRAGEAPLADPADRQVVARTLLWLLDRAEETLSPDRVRGRSVIAARRFDLHLQLAALAAREARADARSRARRGRTAGLSRASAEALLAEAPASTLDPGSPTARILAASAAWPVDEWMALSAERRRFLFRHARTAGVDRAALDAVALGVIDALAARGEGAEVAAWIGLRTEDPEALPEAVWSGARGARLLSLDAASGFPERGPVALHRGVRALEGGDLPAALRSFGAALRHAPDSAASADVARLARRWLSFVAGQFEVSDALLATLRELLPARESAAVLEDLAWRAAFHADAASFTLLRDRDPGTGALGHRLAFLAPLARGDGPGFDAGLRRALAAGPSEGLRLVDLLLQRLELEDDAVRAAQVPTLLAVESALRPLAAGDARDARAVAARVDRCRAIREGAGAGGSPWAEADGIRSVSPDRAVHAGAVRLAPSDPLPWPFAAEEVAAPSVFDPIALIPVTWRDADGRRVFGWRLGG